MVVDSGAAKRFIRNALWEADQEGATAGSKGTKLEEDRPPAGNKRSTKEGDPARKKKKRKQDTDDP